VFFTPAAWDEHVAAHEGEAERLRAAGIDSMSDEEEICANCNEAIEADDTPQECPCGCYRMVCRRCFRTVTKNLRETGRLV
jgi:hypothetical protein